MRTEPKYNIGQRVFILSGYPAKITEQIISDIRIVIGISGFQCDYFFESDYNLEYAPIKKVDLSMGMINGYSENAIFESREELINSL